MMQVKCCGIDFTHRWMAPKNPVCSGGKQHGSLKLPPEITKYIINFGGGGNVLNDGSYMKLSLK